jgi:hypothetical protein
VTAQIMSDLILGTLPQFDVSLFSPQRIPAARQS